MKNYSDEELIKKYRDGSQDAFNEIYSRYKNLVKYFCRNLYLLGAEEGDLIQEGMLGLIKAVNGYSEGDASFKTYLIACIKSSLVNAVKKYGGLKSSPLNNSIKLETLDEIGLFSPPPEEQIVKKEQSSELSKKIYEYLSKNEKEVLTLYLQGYSYVEISTILGKDTKSVDNALSRCRAKIIKKLDKSLK
ncbi:MAG: sigma-70 family RNA polymerase sigma factor [Clostridia bacterium]|nr:sigma-70 family RNA polymerase sigma factor [Clostridia bacterium]